MAGGALIADVAVRGARLRVRIAVGAAPRAAGAAIVIAATVLRHEARPRVVGVLLAGRQRRVEAFDDR